MNMWRKCIKICVTNDYYTANVIWCYSSINSLNRNFVMSYSECSMLNTSVADWKRMHVYTNVLAVTSIWSFLFLSLHSLFLSHPASEVPVIDQPRFFNQPYKYNTNTKFYVNTIQIHWLGTRRKTYLIIWPEVKLGKEVEGFYNLSQEHWSRCVFICVAGISSQVQERTINLGFNSWFVSNYLFYGSVSQNFW